MTGIRPLLYSIGFSLLVGVIVYTILHRENKKVAVVDAIKLFNQYHMKKELEGGTKETLQHMNSQLDSIGNKLRMAQAIKNEEEIKNLSNVYNYLKMRLEDAYTQSNRDINEQVWKRLNPLIEEYGKKKKLHLIIGANGMGSVLYNDDYYDLTNEMVQYANKRYEEGN